MNYLMFQYISKDRVILCKLSWKFINRTCTMLWTLNCKAIYTAFTCEPINFKLYCLIYIVVNKLFQNCFNSSGLPLSIEVISEYSRWSEGRLIFMSVYTTCFHCNVVIYFNSMLHKAIYSYEYLLFLVRQIAIFMLIYLCILMLIKKCTHFLQYIINYNYYKNQHLHRIVNG